MQKIGLWSCVACAYYVREHVPKISGPGSNGVFEGLIPAYFWKPHARAEKEGPRLPNATENI